MNKLFKQVLKKHIPNAITSANLLCGCLAIMQAMEGNTTQAAMLIGLAALFDFFDGLAARLLHVSGEMGKQLDSLADVVSFGVVPGFIFFQLSKTHFAEPSYYPYISMLIPIFSAIRLAKFNIDTRQTDSFIGLPTPANALFIGSLPFVLQGSITNLSVVIQHPTFLILFPFVSAMLLVAELPLLALKFKHFGWKQNEFRYLLILACVLSIIIFKFAGVALSIILYIIISVIYNRINKKQHEI